MKIKSTLFYKLNRVRWKCQNKTCNEEQNAFIRLIETTNKERKI